MPGARVLQHRQRMQRDVRAAPGVGRRREVVGVGLARDLEDADGDVLGELGARGEPFGVGPALKDRARVGIAVVRLFLDVVELVEHQQRGLQGGCRRRRHLLVVEQVDQRRDVVAAEHRAEELRGTFAIDQGAPLGAMGERREITGLDLGGVVDAGRYAVGDQVDQRRLFAGRRRLQQFDQFGGLRRAQRQRRNAERGALGNVLAIGLKHGGTPLWSECGTRSGQAVAR